MKGLKMKYEKLFVTVVMLLFCFLMPVMPDYSGIYGDNSRDNRRNHGDHQGHGNHGTSKLRGVVSSASGSTLSVLGTEIDASAAKIDLKDCDDSLTIDDIIAGDIIEVKGDIKDDSFVAAVITIEGTGKLEGTVEAIDGDTITILGNEIDIASARCVRGTPTPGKKARVYVRNSDTGLTALVVHATRIMGH
ncbi:MAG: hypothetical protein CV087_14270 [Candidatus Brocadia sp. WS118]|nr:MAG: hypothetical protein CV087_14270 [Candidatus Brocadia sp. WS118]